MKYSIKILTPITADPCVLFLGKRSQIQKLNRQSKKKLDFFKRIIMSDDFMAMNIEKNDRCIILARSTRSDSDANWQLSYFYKEEPTMHETFYDLGSKKDGYMMSFRHMLRTLVENAWDGCKVTTMYS